ncbi:formate dehydrogenase subunit delta [Azospirillum griseum]|uniref:Formate dehydrogenase n=1 Tax=Azospirillum griseum TaxID=2496639 RepID=A0A3S0K4E3_9PROT|nr:formate dehydrogenase subunit delta [Azospirillum griseum]RTR20138.1 formate dehydrogenase [Azospirillum griseum]
MTETTATARSRDLVRMANQIASHFASLPPDEATAETAAHIRKFWDPRMRAALFAHSDADGTDLHAVARSAIAVLKQGAVATPSR